MPGPTVTLINTNGMKPPVAPAALDYLAGALQSAGYTADLIDLNYAGDPEDALRAHFSSHSPRLVGLTFRNSDDCFWPSATSFVPRLVALVATVRQVTDAPLVLGGAGFSVFPHALLAATGCDYGIKGDGEAALVQLMQALDGRADWRDIPGLVWRDRDSSEALYRHNAPQLTPDLTLSTARDVVDNPRYFREGGQGGIETKRGCPRDCTYCADPVIKGARVRKRDPREVADEIELLLRQDIDVLHLCDGEFNVPGDHALQVCQEMIRRGLGQRVSWYAYLSVVSFDRELAQAMRQAGCIGINFGADSACDQMLGTYARGYRQDDVGQAIRLCREHGIRVMIDLLLGGPGETETTLRETIDFLKVENPDCVGAALGVRVYPGTRFAAQLRQDGPLAENPSLRRRAGTTGQAVLAEADGLAGGLLSPVFYISESLGERPAQLVRDLIDGDERFFEPVDDQVLANYNYNDNRPLIEAIANGARGAYWDILGRIRSGSG